MTWTYDSTAPGSSAKSLVRLLIGDTSSGDQLLQDEEIEALIALEGNNYTAAALACETIAASFSRRADQKVGQLSIRLSQLSDQYSARADRLRKRGRLRGGVYAGGISRSDVDTVKADTDEVRGQFEVGMTDYPGYEGPAGTDNTSTGRTG